VKATVYHQDYHAAIASRLAALESKATNKIRQQEESFIKILERAKFDLSALASDILIIISQPQNRLILGMIALALCLMLSGCVGGGGGGTRHG
jgi:hypothetical protein